MKLLMILEANRNNKTIQVAVQWNTLEKRDENDFKLPGAHPGHQCYGTFKNIYKQIKM